MTEVNNSASATYKKATRLLTKRLILGKVQSDDFLVDLDDVVDLMNALGFQMREHVPPVPEMMETDVMDTIRMTFHCNNSGYVAVLEKDGSPTVPPQNLCNASHRSPVSDGVSLMVEQVLGKLLHITSVLNDVLNSQPIKRRQSAENFTPAKPKQQLKDIRRAQSVSTLSREATFVLPIKKEQISDQQICNNEVYVDAKVITNLTKIKKDLGGIVDKLRQYTSNSKQLTEIARLMQSASPRMSNVFLTPQITATKSLDCRVTKKNFDTHRPDNQQKY